jgi:hypothetical protein
MQYQQEETPETAIPTAHPSRILPVPRLTTLVSILVIGFLLYAFFTGLTKQFYASVVFSFYALTGSMWVSVVLLGAFQTLLLVPFRIVSLLKSAHLKEFEETVKTIAAEKEKAGFLKKSVKGGRRVALYYLVNFFVQLVSYISIGRLFLTDFYSTRLDPRLLYDFVPYPNYPISDRFFKLPYLWFTDTTDLGMKTVWIVWIVIIAIQAAFFVFRSLRKSVKALQKMPQTAFVSRAASLFAGSTVLLFVVTFFLLRNFPVGWQFRLFSGDVAYPNRTFNTVTALATTFTLIWINIPRIRKKVELARAAGIDESIVWQTQRDMFKDTLRNATVVGLGAFFVTNHIPSAFELSVFTLEVIAFFSPLTLDRLILGTVTLKAPETPMQVKEEQETGQKEADQNTSTPIEEPKTIQKKKIEGEITF